MYNLVPETKPLFYIHPTRNTRNLFCARAGLSRAFLQGAEIYGLCDI